MTRAHVFLVLVCVLCALGVVASQHKARKLYSELERAQEHMTQLETEFSQLQLEQRTWAAHGRVEKIARETLQMAPPKPGMVLALTPVTPGDRP